jgi:SAM-dependent methyltransferase
VASRLGDPIGHAWLASAASPELRRRRERLLARAEGEVVDLGGPGALAALAARPDASADTVVSVLTLCSLPDLGAVVAATKRVLRPGGKFLFLEHVPDWPGAGKSFDMVGPAWKRMGGCDATRDIPRVVRAHGFNLWDLERFTILTVAVPLRSWVAGSAVAPARADGHAEGGGSADRGLTRRGSAGRDSSLRGSEDA